MTASRSAARLAGVATGVALALLAGEVVARVAWPAPRVLEPWTVRVPLGGEWREAPAAASSKLLAPSPDPELARLRGEFRPGTRFRMCYDVAGAPGPAYLDEEGCVEIVINEERYRGPLRPRAKPLGTFRVALVGDSFTFGHGVPFAATWGARVEAELDAGAPPRVEVLNFGVSGFDARDAALYLRHRALAWQPDVAVYGFYPNDLFVGGVAAGEAELADEAARHRALHGEPSGLAAVSRLAAVLERRAAVRRVDGATLQGFLDAARPSSERFGAWRAELADMTAACEAAGVPLVVVVFPVIAELDGDYPLGPVHAAVREAAEALGATVVDVLPAWRGRSVDALRIHPTDAHPGAVACGLAAEVVARALEPFVPR